MTRRLRYAIYKALPSLLAMAVMAAALYWWIDRRQARYLSIAAWEASFTERGLSVPESGPREGYCEAHWGARLFEGLEKHPDHTVRWIHKKVCAVGLFDIDANGEQHWDGRTTGAPYKRIVLVGGSVAWGAQASCRDRTYFAVLGTTLHDQGIPTLIDVVADAGWKSSQEVAALRWYLQRQKPDLIVMLDGLNDLTLGATVAHLAGEKDATGAEHIEDYEARLQAYLANVDAVAGMGRLLVVLQPSLLEKANRTRLEERLRMALGKSGNPEAFLPYCYAAIRHELAERARAGKLHWLDASHPFDGEAFTTHSDLWHFADPGHEVLGKALARLIVDLLSSET